MNNDPLPLAEAITDALTKKDFDKAFQLAVDSFRNSRDERTARLAFGFAVDSLVIGQKGKVDKAIAFLEQEHVFVDSDPSALLRLCELYLHNYSDEKKGKLDDCLGRLENCALSEFPPDAVQKLETIKNEMQRSQVPHELLDRLERFHSNSQ